MRGTFVFFLALGLVGCGRPPGPTEAAIHVEASYDFQAGCIIVEAHDKDAPDKTKSERLIVSGRTPPAKVDVAVYRGADWGSNLVVTVTAHERKCDGPEVARKEQEYTLKKPGVETLAVTLSAPDVDGDTYVATSAGGTDCADNDREINPGVARELCDGLDNDCRNGVDDGFTFVNFYRDEDEDGVGAGEPMRACAAPPGYVSPGEDCDDRDEARAPGLSERCDEVDNNCNDEVDEGLPKSAFYRDVDGDGFGVQAELVMKCRAPTGYVVSATSTFDCDDGNGDVKPDATERCNGVDDNCAGGIDEPFPQKDTPCSNSGCPGTYLCNGAQDATVCSAPAPVSYYPDADQDGQGSSASGAENICPPAAAPAGKVANRDDCDDLDAYNKLGGEELCDDRDNNCSGTKTDEATVCNGKGWKVLNNPVVPNSRDWRTVALGAGGAPVWIAGASGALAYRAASSTGNFTEYHQKCGNITWAAAWVRPSDGSVFLAGDGGNLAMYTAGAASCVTSSTASATGGTTSTRALTGIVGIESGSTTTAYVVNDQGKIFAWTPSSPPVFKLQRSSTDPYWDIQSVSASKLLVAGEATILGLGDYPQVDSIDTGANTRTTHTLTAVPSANNYGLHGIGSWSTGAYAVGRKGNFLAWDGGTNWYFISPDRNMQVDLNSISAPDAWSAYIACQDGRIRRPQGSGWAEHFNSGGNPLKDIAASSRQDIWAVGNGIVVHFLE